ncbi:MAG: AAA family ATPase, partial [Promethearchaeota archaeon]
PFDSPLMDSIAKIVHFLRDLDLRKSPSIAETIDWAQALIHLGITQIDEDVLKQTLPVLLKYQEDLQLIKSKYREMIRLGNM